MTPVLRVASLNIRSGIAADGRNAWPFRRRALAQALAELDADALALQEAHGFQLGFLLDRLPGFAAVGVGRSDGRGRGERCAVLFRIDRLRLLDASTRWLSESPDTPGSRGWGGERPRVVTLARLACREEDESFGIAATHWEGASAEARRHSAELLLEWIDPGEPWVVAGDLNATTGDPAVRRLLAGGLRDALAALPTHGPGAGTHHGFTGAEDRTRIDHILVTPHWRVLAAGVAHPRPGGRLPSDHWPVVATLELAAER